MQASLKRLQAQDAAKNRERLDREAAEHAGCLRLINVCDNCLRASCWHGELFCEMAQSAGTTKKTDAELGELNREHPHHYSRENVERICGSIEWVRP